MSLLAFQEAQKEARALDFFDNDWPGSFNVPFGEWFVQFIEWAQFNPVSAQIGDIVEWPFSTLFTLILSDRVGRDSITTIPWLWVVIAVFLIGSFTRNTRVGLGAAVMLGTCGFLGTGTISGDFWFQTSRTIGMVLVSVLLCAIVGIPLGILSGRMDSVWTVVRPTLDAMQVVHSFVYMLPFIFFFGIGEVSATMVTMVFAIPPLVRLTNLGIRQVPEDVVEAARAYGATELRVLTDVQLPLARPAILTGLNQTLLLSIAMLGIAALMGAGGLGKLLFRAINNFDLRLAAGGGLAFFLVAVTLDRITQTEEDDGVSFFNKLSQAWRFRSDPEGLMDAKAGGDDSPVEEQEEAEPAERLVPVESSERTGLLLTAGGSLLALISVLLPWGNDAGLVAAWGRAADESLPGESFNGIAASGGTFFGVFVAAFALFALLASIRPLITMPSGLSMFSKRIQGIGLGALLSLIVLIWVVNTLFDGSDFSFFGLFSTFEFPNIDTGWLDEIGLVIFGLVVLALLVEIYADGSPRLGADGALIASIGALGAGLGYLILSPPPAVTEYSDGIGVYLAVLGGVIAVAGAAMSTLKAPYASRRPLPLNVSYGRIAGAAAALLLVLGGALLNGNTTTKTEFGWYFDLRDEFTSEVGNVEPDEEVVVGEDGEEVLDPIIDLELLDEDGNPIDVDDVSGDFLRVVYNGVESEGPGLGWLSIGLAILGLGVAIPASGALGGGEQLRWKASVFLAGIGLAMMAVPMGFILGMVRVADLGALSGVGAFVTLVAGFLLFSSGRGVVDEFRRRKIYADHKIHADSAEFIDDEDIEEALALQTS
jgi:glycine betaine/proline transport system permease protein